MKGHCAARFDHGTRPLQGEGVAGIRKGARRKCDDRRPNAQRPGPDLQDRFGATKKIYLM